VKGFVEDSLHHIVCYCGRPSHPTTKAGFLHIGLRLFERMVDNLLRRRMLLADWFSKFAEDDGFEFKQYGHGRDVFTIGSPLELHVKAHCISEAPYLHFVASDPAVQDRVQSLAAKAIDQMAQNPFFGQAWYSVVLTESDLHLSSTTGDFFGGFLTRLGGQVRITGWRRLSGAVLLEFKEAPSEKTDPFVAPKAEIEVHISVPAPRPGYYASYAAHNILETVAAICAFALGRPVDLPGSIFPTAQATLDDLASRHSSESVLTLARKSISLDIFSQVMVDGGLQVFAKERSALITFNAAMSQDSDLVACILYVVTAECIATPNAPWKGTRATKRFCDFFERIMPAELEQIVNHRNFEEIFGIKRGTKGLKTLRRSLLNRIYDYRSGLVHEGLPPTYSGITSSIDGGGAVRRGLFSDFAEGAILRYLTSPRSSLIGHPSLDSPSDSAK
jgi:hypothetical protein